MVLADFYRIVETYLNTDTPTLQIAIVELRAFCRAQQAMGEIWSYSIRGDHTRLHSPGIIRDVDTARGSAVHQLFFSEAFWMNGTVANVLGVPGAGPKTPTPDETPEDAFDRAMGVL